MCVEGEKEREERVMVPGGLEGHGILRHVLPLLLYPFLTALWSQATISCIMFPTAPFRVSLDNINFQDKGIKKKKNPRHCSCITFDLMTRMYQTFAMAKTIFMAMTSF